MLSIIPLTVVPVILECACSAFAISFYNFLAYSYSSPEPVPTSPVSLKFSVISTN